MDSDNDINFVDWALIDANNFTGAFADNGKFLLTDFRGSVIGMADEQGSITADISYDAWGNPYYTDGLEGLSILWNGYYYDSETGNYYLRNRYYSPTERRFITDDPKGIRPDNNWNNTFDVHSQYDNGYGLQVYCESDPINCKDYWGLECGIYEYHNTSGYKHAGLLVNAEDYDFGPATTKPLWGKGECPWKGGGPGDKVRKTKLKIKKSGYLYGNFADNTGEIVKECKCADCGDVIKCISELCSEYDKEEYSYPIVNCLSFVDDAKDLCCLKR
jgi:RHS repeat-associated protein